MLETENPLWVEKYRPRKVVDIILPKSTKDAFQKFVDDEMVPNLLLTGGPGQGKTTAAKAMLEEIRCDYIVINGSLNAGIDVLRHDIANFASTISFMGTRKYVIIDEADYLSTGVQAALRNFIEEFSGNCGFIFTVNRKERIIDALRSRLAEVNFGISSDDAPKIALQFFKRVQGILDSEGVKYDSKILAGFTQKYFPDFRRVLTELQTAAARTGEIDESIMTRGVGNGIHSVFDLLKSKDFNGMRKWVAENSDIDPTDVFSALYTLSTERVAPKALPGFVVTLAEYQFKHASVADAEINLAACLTELMFEGQYL